MNMTYEDAVDQYWQDRMSYGEPRLRISQPSKALSKKTRKGWELHNVRGFLAEVKDDKMGKDHVTLHKHITDGGACYLTDSNTIADATIVIRLDGGEVELMRIDEKYLSKEYTSSYQIRIR